MLPSRYTDRQGAGQLSALGLLQFQEYRTLVNLTNVPHYLERIRVDRFGQQFLKLRRHLEYFAKERTKAYRKEERSFGESIRRTSSTLYGDIPPDFDRTQILYNVLL
ncbi:inovirus Gp2 family protein [Enterobacter cloacae complex sp. ECC445]|uniref:YagK/YfjJ domain-containing protein n=1 Tax=Enterobacter cloacae complex sp. ECC445 TaxID=2913213 RepID=UPI001F20A8FB|nr:inovirus-type Gp2 protein [Enterobacter cloacae complex sp. ECC445]MCG0456820.1 inovirus Gp2 family protein [Enterobacter cloacae complex sp. ECC445]